MPLYEYECDACGRRFEVIQRFSETSTECRLCGQGPVRRLVAAPAFQFKGTGWYVTDYAQKDKSGPSESKGKPTPADKSETKSDSSSSDSPKTTGSSSSPSTTTPSTSKE